jgi:hypothetical protein
MRNSRIAGRPTLPVTAAQPMTGGRAPAAPPKTMYWGVERYSRIV